MSIKMIRSVVVLGLFWAYVLGNDARGLESLKPLADGEQPCMCQLDNGDLVLAYSRQMHPDWRLYYKISTDRGQTWSTEIRAASGNYQVEPALLQDSSSRLWLLWASNVRSQNDTDNIEYMTSMDYGRTWTTHGILITPETVTQKPNLVEIGGEIGVYWGPDGHWATTADAGATWSDVGQLVKTAFNQMIYKAQDNQLWVVAWNGTGIRVWKSKDSYTWSQPIKIAENGSAIAPAVLPEMGQDRYGNFVVVWNSQHHDPNNSDIWYSTSFDNGLSWQPPQRLMQDSGQDKNPGVALIDGSLWVVWNSDRTGYDRVYAFELGPNPWDFNADGWVDLADYAIFSQQWGLDCEAGEVCTRADFDKSGRVDVADLGIFADHWLKKTPWAVPEPWPLP